MNKASTISTTNMINDKANTLMDAIGLVDDAFLLSVNCARENEFPVVKKKTWRWAVLAACFCLTVAVMIFRLKAGENKYYPEAGGEKGVESEFYLDSSKNLHRSSIAETASILQTIETKDVQSARLFINRGTASGNEYDLTMEEDAELLLPLLQSLFNDSTKYTSTERKYKGDEYAFYVAIAFSGGQELTVFVADTDTIRCNSYFFAASKTLDFSPVNEIIYEFTNHRIQGNEHLLNSNLNRSGKTEGQVRHLLNTLSKDEVFAVEIYMNTTIEKGNLFTMTRETEPENTAAILELLFGDSINYDKAEYDFSKFYNTGYLLDHSGELYLCYLTIRLSSSEPNLTVFVLDERTIRCDSFFFASSKLLDLAKLMELIGIGEQS